jgi:hypothetical protein
VVDFDIVDKKIREGSLRLIGRGSGRLVFDLDNGYVVKAARNNKGLAQNKAESQIFSEENSKYLAKIFAVSEDYQFLIMEKGNKVSSLSVVRKYYNVKYNNELFHIKELRDIIIKYNLLIPDLYRTDSWGIINERPVIIDYGFTREVRRRY